MKADLAIYTHVLGVPGQYESVALILSYIMDFNCCANRDGFRKSIHIYLHKEVHALWLLYDAYQNDSENQRQPFCTFLFTI